MYRESVLETTNRETEELFAEVQAGILVAVVQAHAVGVVAIVLASRPEEGVAVGMAEIARHQRFCLKKLNRW